MKKFLAIIFLTIIFTIPFNIKVEAKNYDIDNLKINAKITEKGNVEIEEELSYSFNGDFNGVYRNLEKKGCDGYEISSVSLKDKNDNIITLSKGDREDNNTFQVNDSSDKTRIKIFSKSKDEKKTFILKYTIFNVAKRYEDFSEINWNFYEVENDVKVNKVDFSLSLKDSKFNMEKFKYNPSLDGGEFTTNYDENGVNLYGNYLASLIGIKIRFQPEFLTKEPIPYDGDSNNNNNSGKSEISFIPFLVVIIGAVSFGTFMYSRNVKKLKEAVEKYRKEFEFFEDNVLTSPPTNASPIMVNLLYNESYVMNFTTIIPATIFYLSKKGYYMMSKKEVANKNGNEEILCFKRNKKISMISEAHLRYFMEWMSLYEKNGILTFKNIEKAVNSQEGSEEFENKFLEWEDVVKEDARDLDFYVTIEKDEILSNEALNEKLKWMAYRKYIVKYLNEYEDLEEISNIEEVLIYGPALEIYEMQTEDFAEKVQYLGQNNYSLFLSNICIWNSIDNNIQNNNNNSNNNDTFGGFSSGSDFTGGGGGGSGAF